VAPVPDEIDEAIATVPVDRIAVGRTGQKVTGEFLQIVGKAATIANVPRLTKGRKRKRRLTAFVPVNDCLENRQSILICQ
jgi:hypothetical protein